MSYWNERQIISNFLFKIYTFLTFENNKRKNANVPTCYLI